MTEASSTDTGQIPVVQPTPATAPHSHGFMNLGLVGLSLVILLGIVLGFVGGIASHGIFPAAAGAKGATGAAGKAGAAGPIGPTGSAANVDLTKLGVCVNVTYGGGDGTTVSYVSNVFISTPTLTSGSAESCPNGTFTPVQAAPVPPPTQ